MGVHFPTRGGGSPEQKVPAKPTENPDSSKGSLGSSDTPPPEVRGTPPASHARRPQSRMLFEEPAGEPPPTIKEKVREIKEAGSKIGSAAQTAVLTPLAAVENAKNKVEDAVADKVKETFDPPPPRVGLERPLRDLHDAALNPPHNADPATVDEDQKAYRTRVEEPAAQYHAETTKGEPQSPHQKTDDPKITRTSTY